ncbi:hypothetical protein Pmani_027683 [Petrolisthes manimaculis]|uniref:Uridine phosphorylase n=1 Tax=Petrolisthes manimaculis TaxID=1843537 RepID=A0AAE1P2H0_9EUCA|nr:hypothetical protein Pmani_027683 [Petrolisthes manimaculis]
MSLSTQVNAEGKESNETYTRHADDTVKLRNTNIADMDRDILYHIALDSGIQNLPQMFGDVRFVCLGGTPKRMEKFANYIMKEIDLKLPTGATLLNISQRSYRYAMYKVGPVLCLSHGMGMPSIGILLHELFKLMYHAKCKDPVFFRLGTCGGVGIEGGNLVISQKVVDGYMQPFLDMAVLGQLHRRPAILDQELSEELSDLRMKEDPFTITQGTTMCTYDFYEGQGRLDGAFCEFTEGDKLTFLNHLHDNHIVNMEMESLTFAALCHHAGIRGAVVCVTLLNRLHGDQVAESKEVLEKWQKYPQILISRYIKKHLNIKPN